MKIISHRGFWEKSSEKNTKIAFERSFLNSYGTETDIRDLFGHLVISHDVPTGAEIKFEDFLCLVESNSDKRALTIAVNIKADGLASLLKDALDRHPDIDCFVFDMSIPDMQNYFELNIPVFTRMSEVEQAPVWLDKSSGVWLDSFESDWYSAELIEELLQRQKYVCIVSPELHSRNYANLWKNVHHLKGYERLILCTDHPDLAKGFFL